MSQTLNEFLDEVETKAKIIKSTSDGDIVYSFNIVEIKLIRIIRHLKKHLCEYADADEGFTEGIDRILNGKLNDGDLNEFK